MGELPLHTWEEKIGVTPNSWGVKKTADYAQ
jgi:hypothetical protein